MRLLAGSLTALLLSAPIAAVAADLPPALPVKAPVMAPVVWNWTGFYLGGNAGYSWGRDPYEVAGGSTVRTRTFRSFGQPGESLLSDVTVAGPAFVGAGTANIDGPVAGGQIGYNWQNGAWVFGLETDLQWTGQRGSTNFCLIAGCPAGSFVANADYKLSWFGTARARAGWLVDPRVLLYVTGGAAYGQVKADYVAGVLGLPLLGFEHEHHASWLDDRRRHRRHAVAELDRQGRIPLCRPRQRGERCARRRLDGHHPGPDHHDGHSTRRLPGLQRHACGTTSSALASTITLRPRRLPRSAMQKPRAGPGAFCLTAPHLRNQWPQR